MLTAHPPASQQHSTLTKHMKAQPQALKSLHWHWVRRPWLPRRLTRQLNDRCQAGSPWPPAAATASRHRSTPPSGHQAREGCGAAPARGRGRRGTARQAVCLHGQSRARGVNKEWWWGWRPSSICTLGLQVMPDAVSIASVCQAAAGRAVAAMAAARACTYQQYVPIQPHPGTQLTAALPPTLEVAYVVGVVKQRQELPGHPGHLWEEQRRVVAVTDAVQLTVEDDKRAALVPGRLLPQLLGGGQLLPVVGQGRAGADVLQGVLR